MTQDGSKARNMKRDRFVRIVEKRVNRILDDLDSLSNCSNAKNYEYSEDDVKKVFNELEKKVKDVKLRFQDKHKEDKKVFKLEDQY